MMYKNNFVVSVKCNGKILREVGSCVYLPFGSEYSLLIKNMDYRRAVVDIEVDGVKALSGNLIIDGNTTQEVKGFMRNMKETNRFKFIEKTDEISNHRGDKVEDGLVRVTYQFECMDLPQITYWTNTRTYGPLDDWTCGNTYYFGTKGGSNIKYTANCCTLENNDGITVKGTKVTENYGYGSVGTLESAKNVIVLQLKGKRSKTIEVKKPITVKTKLVCETCGRKSRSSNKFCYNCGTYLN